MHLPFFKKGFYLFIFIEREREKEREGEKHHSVAASRTTPTEDLVHNPDMCPDWESNQQRFGSPASTQSTEPHQPGLHFPFNTVLSMLGICCKDIVAKIQSDISHFT